MSGKVQYKVKARSCRGLGKVKARSRRGQGKVERKGQQKCGCQEVVREGSITDTETQYTNDAVIHVQDNPENV